MERDFASALNDLLRGLDARKKEDLTRLNCDVLLTLRYVSLNSNLLYAAISLWDPLMHCFRLRDKEIVPLPGELGAIIAWPAISLSCIPNTADYFVDVYERYLRLSPTISRRIVHGREIDLLALVDYVASDSSCRRIYRRRAIMICLSARFLFVHGKLNVGHASIISIVEQCEASHTPMPLCTGELFVTLDRLKKDAHPPLSECPVLLQVLYLCLNICNIVHLYKYYCLFINRMTKYCTCCNF